MEGVHGVDVSWLHRANKVDHTKDTTNGANDTSIARARSPSAPPSANSQAASTNQALSKTTSRTPTATERPSSSSSATQQSPAQPARAQPRTRPSASRSASNIEEGKSSRRSGWMSSLSSKFSSQSQPSPPSQTSSGSSRNGQSAPQTSNTLKTAASSQSAPTTPKDGPPEYFPSTSPQSKSGSSFFSSALRKMTSAGYSTPQASKSTITGSLAPRQVLNVDSQRDRCTLKDLEPIRLKRVGFRVDVEIAGGSRYSSNEEPIDTPDRTPAKKIKDKGEGEALKHPTPFKEERERTGPSRNSGEFLTVEPTQQRSGSISSSGDPRGSFSGTQGLFDVDFTGSEDEGEVLVENAPAPAPIPVVTPTPASEAPKAAEGLPSISQSTAPVKQDKPTTDPLRMYRRCCQLREAPVLKRISEQLGAMKENVNDYPHTVKTLNLNGSRMMLADVVCLSDWLEIVPVQNLLLEDANLTDDGIRHILGGLLAVKTADPTKRKRGKSNPSQPRQTSPRRQPGVVVKLTIKNNPKITSDGWRYICTFIHMSRSLKALDVSMIPFPKLAPPLKSLVAPQKVEPVDLATLLSQSISQRKGGSDLEELMISECGLSTPQVGKIIDAVIACKVRRLGLAGNRLDKEGLEHVARYLRESVCQGLDIGGTDLRNNLDGLTAALSVDQPLWALSLANCNLDNSSLGPLFNALIALPDLRFLDLSHNRHLFSRQPSALASLRKYIPKLHRLKRIHLMDCSISAAQAIGLAEILPEVRNLCHINLLENPQLTQLTTASDLAGQEEACAFYASLMTAARISQTLVAIDVDVPDRSATDIVKTLAKQVIAYCLRNMDIYAALDLVSLDDPASALPETFDPDKGVTVPDVLRPFIGYMGEHPHVVHDFSADDEYVAASVGVVKALGYFLGQNANDLPASSRPPSPSSSSTVEGGNARAKEMSKTLLASARQIRVQLQPAMEKQARAGDDMALRRLQFLDQTLQGMVERFEVEYPETRVAGMPVARGPSRSPSIEAIDFSQSPPDTRFHDGAAGYQALPPVTPNPTGATASGIPAPPTPGTASGQGYLTDARRPSETSLASRALGIEEGRMHRLGQRFRRDVMKPVGTDDALHGTSAADPAEPEHLAALRRKLEELGGDEIRRRVVTNGLEATLREFGDDAAALRELERRSPEQFRRLRELQREAERREGMDYGGGAAGSLNT